MNCLHGKYMNEPLVKLLRIAQNHSFCPVMFSHCTTFDRRHFVISKKTVLPITVGQWPIIAGLSSASTGNI